MRRTFSGSIARHCDASTSRTCDVPMPNATAPNAPCVEVWLSPHAIVMPGCVSPSSGPITWTMPCDAARTGRTAGRPPRGSCARAPTSMSSAITSQERPPLIARRHDVIDRRDRALGKADLPPARAQHVERLRRRDLVDQMQADEQLRLPVRQLAAPCAGPRLSGAASRAWVLNGTTLETGIGDRDSGLGTRDSGLGARDSGLGDRDSGLGGSGCGHAFC